MRRLALLTVLASGAAACGELLGVSGTDSQDTPPSTADGGDGSGDPGDAFVGADTGEDGGGDVLAEAAPARRYVFLSNAQLAATLGKAALDGACTTSADGHLAGTYRAFVSGMTPLTMGLDWYLPNGVRVFSGATPPSLTESVVPSAPITMFANGTTLSDASILAWTGANGSDCNGWTPPESGLTFGQVGDATSTTVLWIAAKSVACPTTNYVYCFQQ